MDESIRLKGIDADFFYHFEVTCNGEAYRMRVPPEAVRELVDDLARVSTEVLRLCESRN